MAQHKWHKEIKAWADGAEIESNGGCGWFRDASPDWNDDDYEFRIKPSVKEPSYLYVWLDKDTQLAQLETHEPKGLLEDGLYKYIGKIKLEVDDVGSA
jgi:hypothetical protein